MKEATENRARVEEILAALRPQERRLATLARQEAGRDELLSEAVDWIATLGAQRSGWFTTRRLQSRTRLSEVSAELATVREALRSADGEAQVRRVRLAEARLALEAARQQLEAARATREAAERNRARSDAEAAAVERDTERLSAEVAAAEREVFAVEQIRATPAPAADAEAAAALELLDADLATARRELRALSGEGSSEAASDAAFCASSADSAAGDGESASCEASGAAYQSFAESSIAECSPLACAVVEVGGC
jgi:hypothetical protein